MGTRLQGRDVPETGPLRNIYPVRAERSKGTWVWKPEKRPRTAFPTIGPSPPANRTLFYRIRVLTNLYAGTRKPVKRHLCIYRSLVIISFFCVKILNQINNNKLYELVLIQILTRKGRFRTRNHQDPPNMYVTPY